MKLLDSGLSNHIEMSYHDKMGEFYFFEYFVVIEYNEGIFVNIKSLEEVINRSKHFYGLDKKFGLIVNKINDYSTNPADAMELERQLPNLTHTALVNKNSPSAKNFDLENHFFKNINRCLFHNLEDAQAWILNVIT